MNPIDVIVLIPVVAVILGAIFYIRKAKKKGVKCIGCPDSGTCSGHCCCKAETEE